MEVLAPPAVWQPAAPAETQVIGAAMAAVGRTRGARAPTVDRAQVVAPGWRARDREAKQDREVERAAAVKRDKLAAVVKGDKLVKRVQAVHRALTALCRCRFGSIGSMSKAAQRR
jgi:hypothetical protein